MSAQSIHLPPGAAKRRPAIVPPDACTLAARSGSPRVVPNAAGLSNAVVPLCGLAPARVQRVTFFSLQCRPEFVENAAIAFGATGLLIVWLGGAL